MLTVSSVIRRKKNMDSINSGKHDYQIRVTIREATDYFDEIELTNYMPEFIRKLFFEYDTISFKKFELLVSEELNVYIYFWKKELLSGKEKKDLNNQITTSFYSLSQYIETARLKKRIEQIEVNLTEKSTKISKYEHHLSEVMTKKELEIYESKIVEQIESNLVEKMDTYEEKFADFLAKKELKNYTSELENTKEKLAQLEIEVLESKTYYKKQSDNFITQEELENTKEKLAQLEIEVLEGKTYYKKQGDNFITQEELENTKEKLAQLETELVESNTYYKKQSDNFITQQELEVHGSRIYSRIEAIEAMEANLLAKKISFEQQMEMIVTKQELASYQSNINSKLEGKIGELEIKLIDALKRFQSQLVENIKSDLSSVEKAEKPNALKETAKKYEKQLLSEKSKYMEEIIQTNAIDIQNKVRQVYELFTSENKAIKFKVHKTFVKYSQARLYSNQLNYCFFYWQYLKQYNLSVISMFTVEKEKLKYLKRKLEALPLFIDQYDQKFVNKAFFKLPLSEKKEIMAYIELKELLETYYTMITK